MPIRSCSLLPTPCISTSSQGSAVPGSAGRNWACRPRSWGGVTDGFKDMGFNAVFSGMLGFFQGQGVHGEHAVHDLTAHIAGAAGRGATGAQGKEQRQKVVLGGVRPLGMRGLAAV